MPKSLASDPERAEQSPELHPSSGRPVNGSTRSRRICAPYSTIARRNSARVNWYWVLTRGMIASNASAPSRSRTRF